MSAVLLVDDEPTILKVLVRELEKEGYELRTASSGPEALARVAAGDVAVLVTDQRMPGMLGTELVARVREMSPLTVCVMLVTRSDHEAAARALALGAVHRVLTKPWDFPELQQAIRVAADACELRRRNEALRRESREIAGRIARKVRGGAETIRAALAVIAEELEAGRGAEALRPAMDQAARAAEEMARAVEAIADPAAPLDRPLPDPLAGFDRAPLPLRPPDVLVS